MPEGPEVKTVCDNLQYLINNKLSKLSILSGRYSKNNNLPQYFEQLNSKLPLLIKKIDVKGKLLYFILENDWVILNTFGMSGRWTQTYQKHNHLEILINNETKLWFCDPRCFGTIKILTNLIDLQKKLSSLGPDILNSKIDSNQHWDIQGNSQLHPCTQ